jgi:diguanylate cyclase (GGDEF)-like protein
MRRTKAFESWIDRLSPAQAILLGYGIVLLLAIADYAITIEVSVSIFYLIPVILVAWRSSMRAAVLMCLVSSLVWETIDILHGTRDLASWIYFWNFGARSGFYLVVSVLLQRLRAANRKLTILSNIDSLTGVKNRRAFLESLEIEITRHRRNGQPLSVAFLDVDNLKQINDTLGHQKGDQALQTVAEVLRAHLRKSDVIGRLGGDEFAVLMPETNGEGAFRALSTARSRMLEGMTGPATPVTFSAGIATGMCEANANRILSLEEVLCLADALMYEVKRDGRNDIRQRDLNGI